MNRKQRRIVTKQNRIAGNVAPPIQEVFADAVRHHQVGQLREAEQRYRWIIQADPSHAEALHLLGTLASAGGHPAIALDLIGRAIVHKPDHAIAHFNLAVILRQQGRLEEAVASYRQAVTHKPDYVAAHYNLGNLLQELRRFDEAVASYQAALVHQPDHLIAFNNLAIAFEAQGRLEAAAETLTRALSLKPGFAEARYNLASIRQEQGRLDEALECYAAAARDNPNYPQAEMSHVFTQLYRPGVRLADISDRSRALYERHGARFRDRWTAARREPDDAQRLPRIGFVSADFRAHAVGALVLPAIEGLARAGYPLICYSNNPHTDPITARFVAAATVWRPVAHLSDDALDEQIRADAIDILVDLSGYTAGNRLLVFARKPAPVQVTWIGYPATTGFAAIDYILADRHQVPLGADKFYTEAVVRLPNAYIAFAPPDDAPPVCDIPVSARREIVFGSFNAIKKITPEVVAAWSRILLAVPDSRLVLKATALDCPATRARFAAQFAAHGVTEARLEFIGRTTRAAHLATMQKTDIALDPFPYSGGQTTLEALWMGLPVVTMPGETFASRHAAGYLATIGLDEWVAADLDDYIRLAIDLAANQARLDAPRADLRSRILASALSDVDRFTADLSLAFTIMWRRCCHGEPVRSFDLS